MYGSSFFWLIRGWFKGSGFQGLLSLEFRHLSGIVIGMLKAVKGVKGVQGFEEFCCSLLRFFWVSG